MTLIKLPHMTVTHRCDNPDCPSPEVFKVVNASPNMVSILFCKACDTNYKLHVDANGICTFTRVYDSNPNSKKKD